MSEALGALLEKRNAQVRSSGEVIASYRALLAVHTQLERQHAELKRAATLLQQDKAELSRDVALLNQNESNLGVSSTHIQQLQEKVAVLQHEIGVLQREKAGALQSAAAAHQTCASARDAFGASELARQAAVDEAHAARGTIDALRIELEASRASGLERSARIAALEAESAELVLRYLAQVSSQADALNDGVDAHELLAAAQRQIARLELQTAQLGATAEIDRARARAELAEVREGARSLSWSALSRGALPATVRFSAPVHAGGDASALAFFPDSSAVLSAGADSFAVTDTRSGALRTTGRTQLPLGAVAVDSRAELALGAGGDGEIHLWHVGTGQELHRLAGHSARCASAVFSPDSHGVVSGGHDRTLRWWDVARGACRLTYALESGCNSLAIGSDAALVASAHVDGRIRVWDCRAPRGPGTSARELGSALARPVSSVDLSRDGRLLLSCAHGDSLRLLDLRTGAVVHALAHGDAGSPNAHSWTRACLSPCAQFAAAGGVDGKIYVWAELATGAARLTSVLAPPHETGAATDVSWSPDGMLLASTHADGSVVLWH